LTNLLDDVLDAHGGIGRSNTFAQVEATIVTGGEFWAMKGVEQDESPRRMVVGLQREWSSLRPYGAKDQRTSFTPDRIAVERLDGEVLAERLDPRASFDGHEFGTAWDPLHRAYFNGYALWTYLTCPFAFALPGFTVEEIAPIRDSGQTLAGLQVVYPPGFASHCPVQEFYFGDDFLLRRHDYRVDVAGGFPAVYYVEDFVDADGIKVPTKRRAYRADAAGRALLDTTMVSIDLSDISFT
jgi:hypothetical protein